ncbi:MAG TPA: phage minor head protein, partial [Polyangiales bacterium]|nr:phage minor head protein [Polyangiales bacterium]
MGDGGSWKVTPDVERYDEALDWFGKRTVITGDQAARLDDRLKAEAFWVGGGLKLAQVQRVFDAINVALAKGQTFEDFQKSVRTELRDPAHAELVFRNATQRAYNAGRWAQMYDPETLRFRPFGLVDAVLDARTTHYCRAVNGTLLPLDDPWWDTHWFPAHHHCRTSVRNLRRSEAERRGVKQPPNLTDPDPGWGQSPKLLQPWKPDPKKHEPGLVAELEKQAAGGGTKKRAKREPQHEAKAWTKTYAEYGRAAASLASGRAALEHGLDLPAQDVLQHLDALDAPVVGVLKAALRGTDAQRTLREQAGEIDPLRKVAA